MPSFAKKQAGAVIISYDSSAVRAFSVSLRGETFAAYAPFDFYTKYAITQATTQTITQATTIKNGATIPEYPAEVLFEVV